MQIDLEQFSAAIAAIHLAAASPERWPEAASAVATLMGASTRPPHRGTPFTLDLRGDPQLAADGDDGPGKRLMSLLAPHLETARQVQRRLAEALPGRFALASLDRLATASLIVSGAGVIHHLNIAARALLVHSRFLRVAETRLRFSGDKLNGAFAAALRKATSDPPRSSLLRAPAEDDLYEVAVSPLEERANADPATPLVLVMIARLRPDAGHIVQRVRPLYGLTEAEARVMAELALGKTVSETARAHRVAASTVRAQVRSIFEKTGVNRQTDLVRLALIGAPIATDHD